MIKKFRRPRGFGRKYNILLCYFERFINLNVSILCYSLFVVCGHTIHRNGQEWTEMNRNGTGMDRNGASVMP